MKRLLSLICLCFMLSGCSGAPTYDDALSITNSETGDVVSINDTMDAVDSILGTPQFYPNTNAYFYGNASLPIGWFSAYYDHGTVCCLIVGPDDHSKWEMYGGIKLGDSSESLVDIFDASYKDYENADRHFAVYMFDDDYRITDVSSSAAYLVLFALDSNGDVLSVMLSSSSYLSDIMDLSVF